MHNTPKSVPLSRRIFLLGFLSFLVFGNVLCFLLQRGDIWPFSSYSMYSKPFSAESVQEILPIGVLGDGSELDVYLQWDYTRPLYRGSVKNSLKRFARAQNSDEKLQAAAIDFLKRYESNRKQGLHDGPPLVAMRIYRCVWEFEKADLETRGPTSRTLLAEGRLTSEDAAL